jgi:putative colanic acid biosynthesis UDP-glucose lipid carrier transferase
MARRYSQHTKSLVFLGDLLVLNGLFIALYLADHFIIATYQRSWFAFLAVINISWLVIVFFTNPYRIERGYHIIEIIRDISYTVIQHFFVTCTLIYLLAFELIHQWGPPMVYSGLLAFLVLWRFVLYYSLEYLRLKGHNYRKVVLVGYGELSKKLTFFFDSHSEYGYRLMGVFDNEHGGDGVIDRIEHLKDYVTKNEIDEIYCCLPYLKYGTIKSIVEWGEDNFVKIKVIVDFRAFSFKGIELERYDLMPVLALSSIPLDDRKNQLLKRSFDLVFSIAVIVLVFSWLFPILILAILLDSRGPILFRQKRSGKDNEEFTCYKFRTMKVNHEADTLQATKNDPRVTRVGKLLRKTSLDELPQFFNVLEGTMSVVGPRPHPIKLNEKFLPLVSKYMVRHYAKPGITGLAQVKGFRGETSKIEDMKNRVKLDRFYIDNWSFLLDLKIIVETVTMIFKGSEKAY